jgi:DNA polymerase I-like protein with 3'-5' exonuclease and polymerase domains
MADPSIQPPFDFMLPETNWRVPGELPDLRGRGAKRFTIDCETKDPNLQSKGPGFIRGDAYVAGVALRTDDGWSGYFPVRHMQGQNLAPNIVFPWLADQLKGDQPKIGANLLYDLEALHYSGVTNINGPLYDIQIAEPLIDEETSKGYSLNALALKYLGRTKVEDTLRKASAAYKKGFTGGRRTQKGLPFDPKGDMWMLPPEYVGEYAEADTELPQLILDKQLDIISTENLKQIFQLESSLIPILLKMRLKGIRVDLEGAEKLAKSLTQQIDKFSEEIKYFAGFNVNVDSGKDLAQAYDKFEIPYPRTAAGNPSFVSEWLKSQDDEFSKAVSRKRKLMTMRDDFVMGDIIGESVNGRIHCQMNSLKQDDNGTRSGRFSSTNPNLQQVPARDEEWAPLIRSLFLADEGEVFFKGDYSQQEPRLLVHYASKCKLHGAEEAVAAFHRNPLTDYHDLTTDIVNNKSGKSFKRKQIKGVNLGVMYSMGLDKLCRMLKVSQAEGREILAAYHEALPFVKSLSVLATKTANDRGRITTLLNRVRRFNLWEPIPDKWEREAGIKYKGLAIDEAEAKWPERRLQRYGTHKALNALIQGSAADQTKEAMRVLYYEHGIVPSLQVHDELCGSIPDISVARTYKSVMENCVRLEIPVVCDGQIGRSWGEAKEKVLLAA